MCVYGGMMLVNTHWSAWETYIHKNTYSRGQKKVYVPFSFNDRSTVRNVPFRIYGIFRSYIGTFADSAINGVERDMQFSTWHIFAHKQTVDAE